jgi:hypothetical protein
MRQAVINLIMAYATNMTDDFETPVQTLMADVLIQWANQD